MTIQTSITRNITGLTVYNPTNGVQYVLGQKLGFGNFSEVYSCTDDWSNLLAAKILKPVFTEETLKLKAQKELNILLSLRSPFITFVYDAFECMGDYFIITEKCDFTIEKLFSIPDLCSTSYQWVVSLSRNLLQALHYLHGRGFVHNDIHQGNFFGYFAKTEMLSSAASGALQFKLGDFGVSKLAHEVTHENTRNLSILPPEVVNPNKFGPVDYRVDIYHTGLLLLQIALARQLTFTEKDILEGAPYQLATELEYPFNIPISASLRPQVSLRTKSALEFWKDLNSAIEMYSEA